jgi:hypothetical protein
VAFRDELFERNAIERREVPLLGAHHGSVASSCGWY